MASAASTAFMTWYKLSLLLDERLDWSWTSCWPCWLTLKPDNFSANFPSWPFSIPFSNHAPQKNKNSRVITLPKQSPKNTNLQASLGLLQIIISMNHCLLNLETLPQLHLLFRDKETKQKKVIGSYPQPIPALANGKEIEIGTASESNRVTRNLEREYWESRWGNRVANERRVSIGREEWMGDFETLKEVKQSKNKNTKKQKKGEEMKTRVMNVMVMNEYFGVVKGAWWVFGRRIHSWDLRIGLEIIISFGLTKCLSWPCPLFTI